MMTVHATDTWFTSTRVDERVTRLEEPHVHELLRANFWHIRGQDRDLVVDSGLGVASLRVHRPELFERNPILVITHAHLDHMGSAHEFDERWASSLEPLLRPRGTSISGPELAAQLGINEVLPELLVTGYPDGREPSDYRLVPTSITRSLSDGDTIDLGDEVFEVLHLPGHTPGSICLFGRESGILFSGDVIYDDILLDELHESNKEQYVHSMQRLKRLPVNVVHSGHGGSFGRDRLHQLIDLYLETQRVA